MFTFLDKIFFFFLNLIDKLDIRKKKVLKKITEEETTRYNSVDELMTEFKLEDNRFKKKNPIGYFIYYSIYLPIYRLWHNNLRMYPKEIKWFFQRGYRGWADCDLWGFDSYISKVIYTGLTKLETIQNILPTWQSGMTEEEAKKSWHIIMTEIIYAFKMWHRCSNGDAEFWYAGKDGLHAMKPIFEEKYPEIYLMSKEDDARMRKGMQLFIEHFGALWD